MYLLYCIKWAMAYVGIWFHNAFRSRRFGLYDVNAVGDPVKLGYIVPQIEKDLESPLPESHLQEAADEVLFYGVNSKSECLLVRVARGTNQEADAWIYLKLANGKTYHLAESAGHQQPFEDECQNFSCGKLQMHYLAPMRRWRIFYCGMLKETSDTKKDSEETVFVKFVFLWKASSDAYDLSLNSNPKELASALARTKWRKPFLPPLNKFSEALNFYAQSGVINGTVSVNDGSDYEMYLFGEKKRNLGKSANIAGSKFTKVLGNTPGNGRTFHLGEASAPYIFSNLSYGFVVHPNGHLEAIKDLDINIQPYSVERSSNTIKADFKAGESYEMTGSVVGEPIIFYSEQGWSGFVEVSFIEFKVGNKIGSGIIMSGEVYKKPRKPAKPVSILSFPNSVPLIVPFSDEVSHFQKISGGKGSSLGKLTKLSRQEKTFTVPKGIIVTTAAYNEFLTEKIKNAVTHLENVAYGNVEGDEKEACHMVSRIIVKTPLPRKIRFSIIKHIKKLFGDEVNQRKFAVRSSATGEDTAVLSAAGQMDTFLGVQGFKQICFALKNCWASQFGYTAVEYKKRYGQILNSPMAVVIQEMVACEVSGVIFTCDPVNNNPSIITITANYGLGETVVSGTVEPDTITLRRDSNENLEIDSVTIGMKHEKIVMQDFGGTGTEDIPEDSRGESCLTKELVKRLGKLSIKIEKYYRSSRDIEWGILNGKIYILQSRPVTNAAAETDFEIKHELDSPIRCEGEYFTVANTGEVMPGATSPLGLDLCLKLSCRLFKKMALDKGGADNFSQNNYCPGGMQVFCNHLMLTVTEMITSNGLNTPETKGVMISVFGRILDDPEMMEFAAEKMSGHVPKPSFRNTLRYYWDLFLFDWGMEKIKKKLDEYHLNFLKYHTAKETFTALLNSCSDFDAGVIKHLGSSESSSNWNLTMLQILCKAKENFDTDVYSDFARLLSTSSNVESANVPHNLQDMANQIVKDISCEKFKTMPVEEALEWLEKSKSLSGHKFRQFIKRHGHRCVKEFDVRSITWAMDPKILIHLLQNLVGVGQANNQEDDGYRNIFSELNVPLGMISKFWLKFVLLNCRRAVRGREAGKSLSVKGLNYWRQGYRHLAKQMVAEGRIPDTDLIFFLHLDEIKDLLQTRSPGIISRANARRRLLPVLENYKFPEIMRGIPKPINDTDESAETYEFVADLTMKGIPVSQGVTKGYARVAMTLEDASHLKPGEILITCCTDIGWTPYFPIISGVVTELGGLISHGAVVSREYGLPCIASLQGATKRFYTGDYVLLDGKKGILQRLPQPED